MATLETLTVLKESAKATTNVMTWNALRIDIRVGLPTPPAIF